MKRPMIKRKTVLALAAVILVLTFFVTYVVPVLMTQQGGTASSRLTLSFSGIDKGRDPKGNAVNVSDVKSDKVLARALEIADMSNRYTTEELRGMVLIQPYAASDAINKLTTKTVSTDSKLVAQDSISGAVGSYQIILKDHGFISKQRMKILTDALVKAYSETLREVYLQSASAEPGYSMDEIAELDYPEMLTALLSEGIAVRRYANAFSSASPDFVSASTGLSFADLYSQASAIVNNNLSADDGIIHYYMLTKNTEMRRQYENVRLQRLTLSAQKVNALYVSISNAVSVYNNSTNYVIAGQGDASATNANTDNAYYGQLLDDLVTARNDATDAQYRITNTQTNIQKLEGSGVAPEQYVALAKEVENDVNISFQKLSAIRRQVREMAEEDYDINVANGISVSAMRYSITQRGSLVYNMLTIAVLVCLLYSLWSKASMGARLAAWRTKRKMKKRTAVKK